MAKSPLAHPRIAAIVRKLDEQQLDEAQHLLAQLGDSELFRAATTFLTTRLLRQRGLLTDAQVVDRLERLVRDGGEFPEARELLEATRAGAPARASSRGGSSRPPLPHSMRKEDHAVLEAELRGAFGAAPAGEQPTNLRKPRFPHSPRVPNIPEGSEPLRPPSIPDLDVPGSAPAPGFALGVEPVRAPEKQHEPESPEPEPKREPAPPSPRGLERSFRYSGSDVEEETVTLGKEPPEERRDRTTRREPSSRPLEEDDRPRIVSGAPPPGGPIVTLFDVAKLLDAGKVREALVALGMRDSSEPDHVLMEARVLARAGRGDEARDRVIRLSQAPLLDPEIRAGVARLALELGEARVAFEQARRAHCDDPDQPMVCLTLAWTGARWVRRTASADALRIATRALAQLKSAGGPNEALTTALEACIEAHAGDAEQAVVLARRALQVEPTADGYAALAMASARLGRLDELGRASARLGELEPAEAKALEQGLARHANALFELGARRPRAESAAVIAASEDVWGPLELALIGGSPDDAWQRFTQLAEDTLTQLKGVARREAPALATVAASFLTLAPVSRDFAPWDSTPWSLHRLRALLALLAPGTARARVGRGDAAVVLLGAYAGEVLRQPLELEWQGSIADGQATLRRRGLELSPHELVCEALAGERLSSADELLASAPPEAWSASPRVPAVSQPCPWDPAPWPAPSRMPSYALALRHSVIALHCEHAGGGLDGSASSLRSLDAFVSLIAPDRAPRPVDTTWARRPSVLLGAYVGQLLCDEYDARWAVTNDAHLGHESYSVELSTGRVVRPVLFVWQRLTGRATSLGERVSRWLEGDPS